jgi:hypothetical protein
MLAQPGHGVLDPGRLRRLLRGLRGRRRILQPSRLRDRRGPGLRLPALRQRRAVGFDPREAALGGRAELAKGLLMSSTGLLSLLCSVILGQT